MSSSNLLFIIILAFHMAKHIPFIESTKTPSLSVIGTTGVPPQKHSAHINTDDTDDNNDDDDGGVDEEICGGYLTNQFGVMQTPKFPNKFRVPITCTWIIDGSMIVAQNLTINIYLTQLYVLAGLKFTEYMYYSDDYKVPSHNVIELSEDNVTQIALIQFSSPYLEIKFHMANLHGTHLRVLDRFLNVYGFNITYEIGAPPKEMQCNTKRCSFLGHCYVDGNFTSYQCDCFPGFNGNDCGIGPLCKDKKRLNYCENGGTCKHIGNAAITCLCSSGYKGNKCNVLVHEDLTNIGCTIENSESCSKQCSSTGGDENICECTSNIVSTTPLSSSRGKVRYEATIKLGNSLHYNTTIIDGKDNGGANVLRLTETVSSSLEKHISRFLRNFNITKLNDLEVFTKSPSSSDVSFQFFGAKSDGIRVREAINRMVERGRLGNFSLVPTYLVFRQEPGLMLQSVVLNQRSAVREGSEFILSCVAQGSSKMVFRWYKNGYYVNISRATRNMWTRLLPLDLKDHYTAVLGISKATKLDEGIYTCQVLDFGMQQCQSTRVTIIGIPQLQVYPSSLTIYRGDSLTVRCLSLENMQKYGALGYSWTKNGALFQSDSSTEMWEDLYPDGSILKIKNLQKSVEYTCVVSNSVGTGSSSVYITVIDHGLIELCPEDEAYGIKWLASAPGPTILSDCPGETTGKVARVCEKRDTNKSEWLIPDFSQCISNRLHSIYNEFRGLTFGYQKTNCSTILYSCLEYTMNRQHDFLPGEGGFLLQLLYEIFEYMKATGIQNELEVAANIILKICDIIMGNLLSINNQQQIKQIQDLIQQSMVYHNPQVIQPTTNSPKSLSSTQNHNLNSFRVFSIHVKSLPFSLQMNANQMFLDQLYMEIRSMKSLNEIISNGTFVITAISYRNLSNFLPRIYFTRNSLNEDVDYILASRIISTWLFNTNQTLNESIRPFYLPLDTAHIEIIFPHEHRPNNQWKPMCGYDSKATFEPTWRTDLCITENLMENITRCVCPFSGTFVILLTKKNFNTTTPHIASRPIFLIISCGCCFIQSCIAFTILIPVLYTNKCCVTFLKMQFCTATSTTMAIFILGFFKSLPKEWHNFISSSLTTLLLLGSSTLIAMTLVVQSELGARRKSQKANIAYTIRGAIGLSWLFPILCALCAPLVHNIVEYASMNWWLEYGTFGFVLFLIIEILFVILFCLLFITLIKKLLYLAKKHDKYNGSILRRIGLLYRIAVILFFKIATDIFYLVNMNTNEFIINCIFGLCNILLGFSILFCFVLKSEIKLQLHMNPASRGKEGGAKKYLDDNFCSGSINSPLSFFTNQEIEKDNESGPPTKVPLTVIPSPHHQTIERLPTGTVETFLVSIPTNSTGHHEMNLIKSIESYNVITYTPSHQAASQQIHCIYPDNFNPISGKLGGETNEFVGVGGLDILQGVGQDSIIGIRPNTIETPVLLKQQCPAASHIMSLPVKQQTTHSVTATTTTSTVTIQSIKLSEPVVSHSQSPAPPTITITSTDDEDAIDGMLDRISNDLDYLLNRTTEVPVRRSTTQTQNSSGSSSNFSHISSNNNDSLSSTSSKSLQTQVQIVNTTHVTGHISSNLSVHEVIIEESEE